MRLLAYVGVLLALVTHHHHRITYPSFWIHEAMCIHEHEAAVGYPYLLAWQKIGWNNKSNPYSRGGMQFLYSTWATELRRHHIHGYPTDPANATKWQQVRVSWITWLDSGRSWHQWSTHIVCGVP